MRESIRTTKEKRETKGIDERRQREEKKRMGKLKGAKEKILARRECGCEQRQKVTVYRRKQGGQGVCVCVGNGKQKDERYR